MKKPYRIHIGDGEFKQIEFDTDNYKPDEPTQPIPKGGMDCFGVYRDMNVPACRACLVENACACVMIDNGNETGGDFLLALFAQRSKKKSRAPRGEVN